MAKPRSECNLTLKSTLLSNKCSFLCPQQTLIIYPVESRECFSTQGSTKQLSMFRSFYEPWTHSNPCFYKWKMEAHCSRSWHCYGPPNIITCSFSCHLFSCSTPGWPHVTEEGGPSLGSGHKSGLAQADHGISILLPVINLGMSMKWNSGQWGEIVLATTS